MCIVQTMNSQHYTVIRQRQIKQNSQRELPQEKTRFQSDRSRYACLFGRYLFDYIPASRMGSHINLRVSDSRLACDQAGLFFPLTRDVEDKVCFFVCGVLICSWKVNFSRSSFLSFGELVKKKWQLEKEQAILPLMTYRDWEGDECIFNRFSFKDAL
jgi:hypothetical protein